MKRIDFQDLVTKRFANCQEILLQRNDQYATVDNVLLNFHVAASLQGCTVVRALGGMMAKHTVALHTFINDPWNTERTQWHEKITDIINYCLLLEAAVEELSSPVSYV
jgi:hypothetical protein